MKLLRIVSALLLLPVAHSAWADYFVYNPAPGAAALPLNHQAMPSLLIDIPRPSPSLINSTLHFTTSFQMGGGTAASSYFTDVTFTTDAAGSIVSWALTGHESSRFRYIAFASTLQGETFSEWVSLSPTAVPAGSVSEGPNYSAAPGTWTLVPWALPVPEPASLWMMAIGLVALAGRGRFAKQQRQWSASADKR